MARATSGLDFSYALVALKQGAKLRRAGWNGKDQWIQAQFPDELSKMTAPYIYIRTQQNDFIPWLVSQGDLFALDWEEVE